MQSATDSATVLNSSARASRGAAPTAERASRKASSYGFTTRRWRNPKLLMARAAAPMLRGLRGLTRTTRNRSSSGWAVGTLIIAQVNPGALKLGTYLILLPLILVQAAGYRRPVRSERSAGLAFGSGVGVLYAVTTISGPPLAVALNNQGFSKQEFRAALGLVRLIEATLTAFAYLAAGFFGRESAGLLPWLVPSVLVGVPLRALALRHIRPQTFRRVCMSFDAWVVSFGISTLARTLHVVESSAAFSVMAIVISIDAWLLYRFFSRDQIRMVTHAA